MGLTWRDSTNVEPGDVVRADRAGSTFMVWVEPNNMGDYEWTTYDDNAGQGIHRIEGSASTFSAAKRQAEKAERFLWRVL